MTSSAVANGEGGTERPRAFAVFRDDKLEPCGLFDGQFAGFYAFDKPKAPMRISLPLSKSSLETAKRERRPRTTKKARVPS
jgi:hypothetical protein